MGHHDRPWQDKQAVLKHFGGKHSQAKRRYRSFIEKGVHQGRREDLIGGGLLRSVGGWSNLKMLRKAKYFYKSDERILGDSDFVEKVLLHAQEQMERKYRLRSSGVGLEQLLAIAARKFDIEPRRILVPGKERKRVAARSLLCYWAVRELGIPLTALSEKLGISAAGVSLSVQRGEGIAEERGYSLREALKL